MKTSGGIFNCEQKASRLAEVEADLADPEVWSDREKSRELGRERSRLQSDLSLVDSFSTELQDAGDLLQLADDESDHETLIELDSDVQGLGRRLAELEFRRMFSRSADPNDAWLEITAGAGGTEAQDWADMLLRMYLRWCEQHGFETEIIGKWPGEVSGIKSVTVQARGDHAYGWLRTETGVHRLVRKSPFDSSNRRHTSFAAVFISPDVDENIEVEIKPADLRVDTYRASGAGGQHVNKTDSAVRLTHRPSGLVVQCQSQRSQHQNRDMAMRQLRAKLYELEQQARNEERRQLEEGKADIGWGSQIRSYVLDDGRIKDLRTGVETGNCNAVLDGDLDRFIEASLKAGL